MLNGSGECIEQLRSSNRTAQSARPHQYEMDPIAHIPDSIPHWRDSHMRYLGLAPFKFHTSLHLTRAARVQRPIGIRSPRSRYMTFTIVQRVGRVQRVDNHIRLQRKGKLNTKYCMT